MTKDKNEPFKEHAVKVITCKNILRGNGGDLSDTEKKSLLLTLAKENTPLYAISGLITSSMQKTGERGVSTRFNGEFVARSLITNDLYKSTAYYADSKEFSEVLENKFKSRNDNQDAVSFTAVVKVVLSSKSPTGYTFLIEPMRDAEAVSRAKEMAKELYNYKPDQGLLN